MTLPPSPSASTHRQSVTLGSRQSASSLLVWHLQTRFCSVAAVTRVVRAAAAAQCSPLRRCQRQRHCLQLSIATLSSTISPSLCHHSHHYQPQVLIFFLSYFVVWLILQQNEIYKCVVCDKMI